MIALLVFGACFILGAAMVGVIRHRRDRATMRRRRTSAVLMTAGIAVTRMRAEVRTLEAIRARLWAQTPPTPHRLQCEGWPPPPLAEAETAVANGRDLLEKYEDRLARAYAREGVALPLPDLDPWAHCPECGAFGAHLALGVRDGRWRRQCWGCGREFLDDLAKEKR
ncbi:MAG: hypothetical protein ACRDTZ_05385 [Pseudonocardiaceae bacterium]